MVRSMRQQILVGGVGGQGVLFVTRLLAEVAIRKGLPVLTTETHGMAQRGGTVVSHLKVGDYSSPMIRPSKADVLLALMPENVEQMGTYLKPGGWIAVNRPGTAMHEQGRSVFSVDADRLAAEIGNPRSTNLVLLGFALARNPGKGTGPDRFCSLDDLRSVLRKRLVRRERLLAISIKALEAGYGAA